MTWTNRDSSPVRELHLRLYPNAFSGQGGGILIEDAGPQDVVLNYSVSGPQNTTLILLLRDPVSPGDRVSFNMSFVITVPHIADRFGLSGDILALGNWHPIMSILRDGSWVDHPYFEHGECFYSEASDYLVEVIVPRGLVIAATGDLKSVEELDESRELQVWVAESVRDFSLTASWRYEISQATWGDVTVYSYYLPEHREGGEAVLQYALNAIRVFSEHFSPYPFSSFRVAEVEAWFGGMEYPQLIMVSGNFYTGDKRTLEMIVAHETAHQWWYSLVGNDQWEEPWLDESLAEYSQILYFEWVYGPKDAERGFWDFVGNPYYLYIEGGGEALPTGISVGQVADDPDAYRAAVYLRGAWSLRMLRSIIGDQPFFEALRIYASSHAYGIATSQDLIHAFEEAWGGDLNWFFQEWIFEGCVPSYNVTSVQGDSSLRVEIRQELTHCSQPSSPKKMPVELYFQPCGSEVKVWVNQTVVEATFDLNCTPEYVIPDPRDRIPGRDFAWASKWNQSKNVNSRRVNTPLLLAIASIGSLAVLLLLTIRRSSDIERDQ